MGQEIKGWTFQDPEEQGWSFSTPEESGWTFSEPERVPLEMPKRPGVLSAIGAGLKETGKDIIAPVEGAVRTVAGIPAWMSGLATTILAQPFVGWEKGAETGHKVTEALMGGGARFGGEKTANVEEMLSPLAAPFSLALEKVPEVMAPNEPGTQAMLGAGLGAFIVLAPKLGIKPGTLLKEAKRVVWREKSIPAQQKAAVIAELNKAEAGGAKTVGEIVEPAPKPVAEPAPVGPKIKTAAEKRMGPKELAEWEKQRLGTATPAFKEGKTGKIYSGEIGETNHAQMIGRVEKSGANLDDLTPGWIKDDGSFATSQEVQAQRTTAKTIVEPPPGNPVPPGMTREEFMRASIDEVDAAWSNAQGLGVVAPGFARPGASDSIARTIIQHEPSTLAKAGQVVAGVATHPGKVANKAMFELIDRYDPFRRWENRIVESLQKAEKAGKLEPGSKAEQVAKHGIPIDESAYNLLQLRGGAGGVAEQAYYDLKTLFKYVGDKSTHFTDYMVDLRLMERAGRGIKNPGGITMEQAFNDWINIRSTLRRWEQEAFKMTARNYTEWANENIIKRLQDASMLSAKDAAKIIESNKHPVPFQKFSAKEDILRFINDISFENMKPGEKYTNVVGKKIFEMTGMDKNAKIIDPWQAVIERLSAVVGVSERNKALLSFVESSMLSKSTRRLVRQVKSDTMLPPSFGKFSVVKEGRTKMYSAPIDIIESIKTLQAKDVSFITNLMGHTKQAFTMGTTGLNLPFGLISNPIRDFWTASITSKYGFNPVSYVKGLSHSLAANFGFPTKLYREYLQAHAGYGHFLSRNPKLRSSELFIETRGLPRAADTALELARRVVNPLSLIQGVTKSIEMAPRMTAFQSALKGLHKDFPQYTPEQIRLRAGLLSRRSTIDFHRAGDFVKTFNYFVPFINARVQSVALTLDAMFSKTGARAGKSSVMGIRGDPRAVAMARIGIFITTPALAAYLYNRLYHSDAYDTIPDDTKDRYIVIMTGTSSKDPDTGVVKPEAILIPKTDAHQMLWNQVESFLEWAWRKEPQDIKKVATNFFSNVSPVQFEKEGEFSLSRAISGVVPPVMQGPLSIASNKDFFWDRPLIPERLKSVSPKEQYTSYTPELYKKIGKITGASPIKTQKMAESVVGTLARTPTPAAIGKGLKERVFRRVGKEMVADIYDIDKKAKTGYDTARIRAERLAKEGKIAEARKTMKDWNERIIPVVKEMAEALGKPPMYVRRQGWYKMYTFSPDDIMNTLRRAKKQPQTSLKRNLGIK